MATYIELHSRSAFSFLEGASLPEELATVCVRMEMPAMALLDRDGVYGAPRFHMAAKKLGIRAHIGAEVTLCDGSRLPLLVQNRAGYRNLCRLITLTKLRAPKHPKGGVGTTLSARHGAGVGGRPHLHTAASDEELRAHSEGLIALTGGLDGPLACALRGCSSGNRKGMASAMPEPAAWEGGLQPLSGVVGPQRLKPQFPGPVFGTVETVPLHDRHEARYSSLIAEDSFRGSDNGYEAALKTARRLVDIFGAKNVYAELQRHCNREQEARNQAVIGIARRLGLPLLATNGVCYARPERREILDAFTCIRHKVRLDTAGRLLEQNSERHLKLPREMARLFADLPEAIANTVELSSCLEFTLADLGYQFPEYPVPAGETMASFLRARTWEGARSRYGALTDSSPAKRQIERELDLIAKLDLAGYFLIVWDIVEFCRRQGILVQGRGSAANSAVCYSLGITAVDPIAMGLLFERFLSEERGEWPDIDLDLPSGERRERVIQYVYQRYGQCGAAMTANVITYRGRSASREIGKVLGFDEALLGRLAGLVGTWEWHDPQDTPERQFGDAGLDLSEPHIKKFFELYLAVQDLPRHLGQHSGGMVMCQGRLDAVVPLEPASMPGRVVVQWDKDDCADLGMIKVDLLGLGMMAALEESLTLIREAYGEEVDLARLPADDPAVYSALQQADTVGMFQVESRAQMACLPRLRPTKFYDIVVQVGIIRPGPIVGKMVHPYLKRRQGKEPPECFHPSLEPVLRRTLGVPLFQEQLLRMAMIAAGFSGGEAEELRRAFSHKRSAERMREIEVKLRRGMESNGITGKVQDDIVQSISAFALYGFPESHAASFALLAYASAYIKCHYLAAFTAALLNNQPMGFYHPATIVKDAQRHGLKIHPMDVTRSEWLCTVETSEFGVRDSGLGLPNSGFRIPNYEPSMRLGLLYARGLREEAARAIIEQRTERPFADVEDLMRRVPQLRKNEIERLAEAGALNFIGGRGDTARQSGRNQSNQEPAAGSVSRSFLPMVRMTTSPKGDVIRKSPNDDVILKSEATKDLLRAQQRIHRREALWQAESAGRPSGPLLRDAPPEESACPLLPMSYGERLESDFRVAGLSLGKHALALCRAELRRLGVVRAVDLPDVRNGAPIRIAGSVIVRQRPGTAKGFVFLSLEDETGIANAIVTPDLFERCRMTLAHAPFLLIEGILQNVDNVVSVKAKNVQPLAIGEPAAASHDFH